MQQEKLVITGVPGTGKSTVAERLGKRTGLDVLKVDHNFIEDNGLSIEYDEERKSTVVDLDKLKGRLIDFKGILESHLLCEFHLSNSIVIVLRCNPETLEKRLEKRGYDKKKIRENLESEAMGYCSNRAKENYEDVYEIETQDKEVKEVVEEILRVIKGESEGEEDIDYSDYLLSSF